MTGPELLGAVMQRRDQRFEQTRARLRGAAHSDASKGAKPQSQVLGTESKTVSCFCLDAVAPRLFIERNAQACSVTKCPLNQDRDPARDWARSLHGHRGLLYAAHRPAACFA
jgi:hypothetical protein